MPFVFAGPLLTLSFTGGGSICAVPVPDEIADALGAAGVRRVVGTMEGPGGSADFNLALLGKRGGPRHLMVSRARMRALGAEPGSTLGVEMVPDPTPDDVAVPDELVAALADNPVAAERFAAMTPGRRRSLVHHVTAARRAETRLDRARDLAHKLATHTLYGDKQP